MQPGISHSHHHSKYTSNQLNLLQNNGSKYQNGQQQICELQHTNILLKLAQNCGQGVQKIMNK